MGVWNGQEAMGEMLTLEHSVALDPSHSLTLPLPADAGSESKLLLAEAPDTGILLGKLWFEQTSNLLRRWATGVVL